jgi:hypothetical protein
MVGIGALLVLAGCGSDGDTTAGGTSASPTTPAAASTTVPSAATAATTQATSPEATTPAATTPGTVAPTTLTPSATATRRPPARLTLGEEATYSVNGRPVLRVVVSSPRTATADPTLARRPQGVYVVFPVSVRVVAQPPLGTTGSREFAVRSTGGGTVSPLFISGFGRTPQLFGASVGSTVRGVLVFDLPTPHGSLVFRDNRSREIGEWRF